ncbi:MAG: hypothetical protein KDF65_02035 [Anaerolineae bacterium]|nr:hypothetical protein [Anaerolineae bacterium]
MNPLPRPWWLLVNKSTSLMTTIEEQYRPGEQTFVIRGEPMVQGLSWLTWGPAGAVLSIAGLTGLAIALDVSERSWAFKLLFIAAFVVGPALAWGLVALVSVRLAEPYLRAVRQAERQDCTLRLSQEQGQLLYQSTDPAAAWEVAYADIQGVEVTYPIGVREGSRPLLTLHTRRGPLVLLDERLGNKSQKLDLVGKIEAALKTNNKGA